MLDADGTGANRDCLHWDKEDERTKEGHGQEQGLIRGREIKGKHFDRTFKKKEKNPNTLF